MIRAGLSRKWEMKRWGSQPCKVQVPGILNTGSTGPGGSIPSMLRNSKEPSVAGREKSELRDGGDSHTSL